MKVVNPKYTDEQNAEACRLLIEGKDTSPAYETTHATLAVTPENRERITAELSKMKSGKMLILPNTISVMPAPLTYRNEYPTEPGWYWVYHLREDQISKTEESYMWCVYYFDKDIAKGPVSKPLPKWCYFAGPIQPPERPEGVK